MVATQRRSGSASCAPSAAGKLQPRPPECGSWNHERWSSRLRMPSCVPSSEKTLDVSPASASPRRSEEHTSELQSLMRISYAVFCLKKKKQHNTDIQITKI